MSKFYNTNLPPDLRALKEEIEGHARAYGLDFYETIFEVVDADDLNEIAAYGGFPMRCNHTVDQKLVMAHVYGHCLAPETKVETRAGVKPIAEVAAGEQVLTH